MFPPEANGPKQKVNARPWVYRSGFFSRAEADVYLQILRDELQWSEKEVVIYGKRIKQPRLVAFYGDAGLEYRYSGQSMEALPWHALLTKIKTHLEQWSGHTFNNVLANLYRDENDSMGWHRDNEKELGENPVIASVSFGESRTFKLKSIAKKITENYVLAHGDLFLMYPQTQRDWMHSVPKERVEKGLRINLTFRDIRKAVDK